MDIDPLLKLHVLPNQLTPDCKSLPLISNGIESISNFLEDYIICH